MSVVMSMRWNGLRPEDYEAVRERVNWEGQPATGGEFHIAAFDEGGLSVTDIWRSAEDMQRFMEDRLMPVVQQLGYTTRPSIDIRPVHALWTPAYERKEEAYA